MDFGESGSTIVFIIVIVLLLVANVFLRKRKAEGTPLGKVVSIFSELRYNQKLTETFNFHWRSNKFKTSSWNRNNAKIDFVPQELLAMLSHAFEMAEDCNQRIDAAKKYRSDSYMAAIDVDKMKVPLAKCIQRLQEWLQENMQNPEYMPKRRGLFG